jgi:multidrug efflux pump subunit AcrB
VPLIGSTLTPIVVFLPLISITGVTGTFFRALAVAMSVSLLTSLALALGGRPIWALTLSAGARRLRDAAQLYRTNWTPIQRSLVNRPVHPKWNSCEG